MIPRKKHGLGERTAIQSLSVWETIGPTSTVGCCNVVPPSDVNVGF